MQEISIRLLCDKTRAETGTKVDATQVRILEYGKIRRRLDLTDDKAAELDALLKPWLDAGSDEDAKPTARVGFKAGSRESRDFYAGLRAWADREERTAEYTVNHRGGKKVAKINYRYPEKLVEDYEAYLASQARSAA